MTEVFICSTAQELRELEGISAAVEQLGGRVLHSYPPKVLIAALPPERIPSLAARADLKVVTAEKVPETALSDAGEDVRFCARMWNDRLAARQRPAPRHEGLSWDSPPRLPPDPPAEIQREFRRREREMRRKK